MNRSDINKCLRNFRQRLIILTQSPIFSQPSKGSLHNPTSRLNRKTRFCPLDHFVIYPQPCSADVGHRWAVISVVNHDSCPTAGKWYPLQHVTNTYLILNIGRVNSYSQQQTQGVRGYLSLASLHFFAAIKASRPPFSVVLTDWLSTIMVLG